MDNRTSLLSSLIAAEQESCAEETSIAIMASLETRQPELVLDARTT